MWMILRFYNIQLWSHSYISHAALESASILAHESGIRVLFQLLHPIRHEFEDLMFPKEQSNYVGQFHEGLRSGQGLLGRTEDTLSRKHGSKETLKFHIFPQTGLRVGFYLRKKETGHAGGRAVLCWARIWPCWARWAGLGVGFGSGGRAGLGWAWDLAVLGGRVGCGFGFLCMVYIVHVFFMPS